MALTETAQIQHTLERSEHPLIVLPSLAGVDLFACAFGLAQILEKQKKHVAIATAANVPPALKRLCPARDVTCALPQLKSLIVEVDTERVKLARIKQEEVGSHLRFILTPEQGAWKKEDVRFSFSSYPYDLVICIGVQELANLGVLHDEYADFFYRTPLLNIDHSPANEHFGQMNLVDVTCASCSEVCHRLIETIWPMLIDEDIATLLLTGMIAKTKSFRTRNVSPHTLSVASSLIEKGARREEIVNELYRVRSISTLRLWGRALARLKQNEQHGIVWTILSQQDFLLAGADDTDLADVIDELITSSKDAQVALILYEDHAHHIQGILRAHPPHQASALVQAFHPVGNQQETRFTLKDMNLVSAERAVLDAIIPR